MNCYMLHLMCREAALADDGKQRRVSFLLEPEVDDAIEEYCAKTFGPSYNIKSAQVNAWLRKVLTDIGLLKAPKSD